MPRYYAVLRKKRARVFPQGTTVLVESPSEEYGGPHRDRRLYVYELDLEPRQLSGGPEKFRLVEAVELRFSLYGERLMSLDELYELEQRMEERERELEC